MRVEIGDTTHLAPSPEALHALVQEDDVSRVAWDADFDFQALDPEVVSLLYGMGRWWEYARREAPPGVARLLELIRMNRAPCVLARVPSSGWPDSGSVVLDYGAGLVNVLDGRNSELETLCRTVGQKIKHGEIRRSSLPPSYWELVEREYANPIRQKLHQVAKYGNIRVSLGKSDAYLVSRGSSLGDVTRLMSRSGLDVRGIGNLTSNINFNVLLGVANEWEMVTGRPSPVIMFPHRRGGEVARGVSVFPNATYLVCAEANGYNPVLRHVREVFPCST